MDYNNNMSNVLKIHCENKNLYMNKELINSLNKLFHKIDDDFGNLPDNEKSKWVAREAIGNFITSAPLSKNTNNIEHITSLDGIEPLIKWVTEQLFNNASFLGAQSYDNIIFNNMWANLQFKDSEIKCHTHYNKLQINNPTGVGIFYINAPVNSGEFVVIKNGVLGTTIDEYEDSNCEYIKVQSGDFIIHDCLIPHAVSKHENDEPRICLVFDFYYTD